MLVNLWDYHQIMGAQAQLSTVLKSTELKLNKQTKRTSQCLKPFQLQYQCVPVASRVRIIYLFADLWSIHYAYDGTCVYLFMINVRVYILYTKFYLPMYIKYHLGINFSKNDIVNTDQLVLFMKTNKFIHSPSLN